jgi:hypothetical protein
MAPSYKEKLIEVEKRLREISNGKVIEDLRNAKLSYVHQTIGIKTAGLISTIRKIANRRKIDIDISPLKTEFVANWLAESARGIHAINQAERVVEHLDSKLTAAERVNRELMLKILALEKNNVDLNGVIGEIQGHLDRIELAIEADPDPALRNPTIVDIVSAMIDDGRPTTS